ncbi:MAG: hypothetical protein AB7V07_02145 [Candidatus Delongbacteria bacterium]
MMLYIVSESHNEQENIFEKTCNSTGIDYRLLNFADPYLNISIQDEKILINGSSVNFADTFYLNNIRPEFPFIPAPEPDTGYRAFSDSYVSLQQRKSHYYSVLSVLSRNCRVVNNFEKYKDMYSKIDMLNKLNDTGLQIAEYCITNNIKCLYRNILQNEKIFFWSCVEHQSPIKRINLNKLPELLSIENDTPYILYKMNEGRNVRIWILGGHPVMAALVTDPEYEKGVLSLEKYEYIYELGFFKKDAEMIYEKFDLDFIEVYGIVDAEERFHIYGIDILPSFSGLDEKAGKWLAGKVLEYLTGKRSEYPAPDKGIRATVFLKKMLEPLIDSDMS